MMEQATMPEAPPMSARFRIAESDYVRAGAFDTRAKVRVRSRFFLFAVLVVVALIALLTAASIAWGQKNVVTVCGVVLAVWLVTMFFIRPWRRRREYRQYKAIHDEWVVTLLDDGIRFAWPDGEGLLPWSKIFKWRCNAGYVLIYTMPSLFCGIPTAGMAEQGFDMERLKAALAQHVGPAEWGR